MNSMACVGSSSSSGSSKLIQMETLVKSESDIGPIVQIKTEKMDEPDDGISIEVDTDTSDNDDEDDCFSDCITFTSSIIRGRKNTMDDEFVGDVEFGFDSDDDSGAIQSAGHGNLQIVAFNPMESLSKHKTSHLQIRPKSQSMRLMCADELFSVNEAKISCFEVPSLKVKSIEQRCLVAIPNNDKTKEQSAEIETTSHQSDRNESGQHSTAQANDDPAENINFDVKLGKSTDFEPITWHFPDTNQCPLKQCMLSRSDRNEAFNHFCMDHADITMLCLFCNELILAVNSDDLRRHHEDKHPNEVQPKLKTNSRRVSIELDEDTPTSNIYCWDCGKANTNLQCSKCVRHYHKNCVENRVGFDRICIECSKKDDFKAFDVKRIPKILDFIKKDVKFASLVNIRFTNESTQKAIDLLQMEQKTYESVKEFEDDIKWFKHNCRTIYPHDREIQKALKRLIGCVKGHIQIVQIVSCDECYENTYDCCTKNSITKPCSKPHLLLWAKVKGYSYWPAKVMAISIDKKKVYVQFFGDYSNSILKITRNNCYLYSKEYPDGKSHPHSESFSEALFDAEVYIDNIQKTHYPKFNYAPSIVFDPRQISNYLNQMKTGWDGMIAETNDESNENAENSIGNDEVENEGDGINGGGSNDQTNQRSARKKRVRKDSTNSPRAKKSRIEKAADDIAHGLLVYNQVHCENIKKIEKLQEDLCKLKNGKKTLEQKNASLVKENKRLERMVAALNEEKTKSDDEKNTLMEANRALGMEKEKIDGEKKALEQKIENLERINNQIFQMLKPPQ